MTEGPPPDPTLRETLEAFTGREAIYHESFCLCHVRLETIHVHEQGARLTLSVLQGISAWLDPNPSTTIGVDWDMLAVSEHMVWTTAVPWWLNFDPAVVSAVPRIGAALPAALSDLARYRAIRHQLVEEDLSL